MADLNESHGGVKDSVTSTAGTPQTSGDNVVVPFDTQASATDQILATEGKILTGVTKSTAHAWTAGDVLYWDDGASSVTRTPGPFRIGFAAEDATAAATTGSVLVRVAPGRLWGASTAASAAVTNTADETAFDETVVIPAGALVDGSVLHIRAWGIATATNSTDTLQAKLRLADGTNTIALVTTTALDVADNDTFVLDCWVTIRTDGASGTLVASGHFFEDAESSVTGQHDTVNSSTVDTTAAITIDVTANWSAADAGNSCRLDQIIVERIN